MNHHRSLRILLWSQFHEGVPDAEIRSWALDLIAGLPERARQILSEYYGLKGEELRVDAIAARHGISPVRVRSLVRETIRALALGRRRRECADCGVSIEHRGPAARRCLVCAEKRTRSLEAGRKGRIKRQLAKARASIAPEEKAELGTPVASTHTCARRRAPSACPP